MEALGWIFWAVLLWSAATSLYWFIKKSGGIQASTMSTMINQWILAAWPLYFFEFNKLHLAWLGILTYFWGLPSMMLFFRSGKHWILVGAIAINVALLVWLTP
jgi:hypothetical protein